MLLIIVGYENSYRLNKIIVSCLAFQVFLSDLFHEILSAWGPPVFFKSLTEEFKEEDKNESGDRNIQEVETKRPSDRRRKAPSQPSEGRDRHGDASTSDRSRERSDGYLDGGSVPAESSVPALGAV